ncbi:MAG: GNAT family N-acetyltransferase [Calditrichia bacterium]|nr:GNAT family N-acetyltransferase [Calditrichia bacterium]
MEIIITKINNQEIDKLHTLIVKTISDCYPEYYPNEAVDFFISYSNKDELTKDSLNHTVVVAKIDNKIVGTGTLKNNHIKRVFVDLEYQGKGIGKKIMNYLEKTALDQDYKLTELHSSLFAKKFYDCIGYKFFKIGKVEVEKNEILYYQRMAKSLVNIKTNSDYDFNKKKFKVIRNDGQDAEVNMDTIFHYIQNQELLYAEYSGGLVKYGEIFGVIENDAISFYYEQENLKDIKSRGKSTDKIKILENGKLQLIDEWEWSSKNGRGICILEEI